MELTYRLITDQQSFDTFCALLKASSLPFQDLDFKKDLLVGYYEGDELVGTGGLEVYGDYALLRSLSVKFGIRGKAVGTTITDFLMNEARTKGLKAIYLLTETAKGFFLKKGFVEALRDQVPAELKNSSEFSHVCPTTASVMAFTL